jgi:hypothetical protein
VESNWVHSALQPLIGLLCQLRVIMMMEKLVEWLEGETEVLGENLLQCHFVHHKPHMLPRREPGLPRWKPATNCLSYSTANTGQYREKEWNVECSAQNNVEQSFSFWSAILGCVLSLFFFRLCQTKSHFWGFTLFTAENGRYHCKISFTTLFC